MSFSRADADRIAITGIGIISPFGRGKQAALEALREGRSGVRILTSIDPTALNCRIAGEVPAEAHEGTHKGHDRFTRFALIAADEALEQAGPLGAQSDRVSVIFGTGLGGTETVDASYRRMYAENARIAPMSIPMSMYNAAGAAIAQRAGARGIGYSVVSACASSAHAIGLAMQTLRSGGADVVITGGSDAPLAPGIIKGWESLRVLAIDNEHPEAACRPFSADRKGLVLAEGAAVFVLETFVHARSRHAEILGEIAGFGATSDAGHLTDPDASGAARAIELAIKDARWNASDVDYVNAHGTATRANDPAEARAIRETLGAEVAVSSTKSMHGHAMGASGAIEIASSLLALHAGFLPPTINLSEVDPDCTLDHVPNQPREASARTFLSNSFGFGGMNAVVAVKARPL